MKEKETNETKFVKIYNRNNLDSTSLSVFETQIEKEKNLNIKNLAIYEKVIINDIYVILVIRKYENTLTELINEKEVSEDDINVIIMKIMKIIKELHDNGITYNNIKPNNILFDVENELYLVDNLILLLNKKEINNQYEEDKICYLSPEILNNEEIDMKSDLWNIGVLIYILVTKRNPFDRINKEETVKSIMECKYEEIGYENTYYRIIFKLLKVNKKERIEFDKLINEIDEINYRSEIEKIEKMIKDDKNNEVYIYIY